MTTEHRSPNASPATQPVASPIYRPLLRSLACVGILCTMSVVMAIVSDAIQLDDFGKHDVHAPTRLGLVLCVLVGLGLAGTGMVRSLTASSPSAKAFLGGLALWAAHGVLLLSGIYAPFGHR